MVSTQQEEPSFSADVGGEDELPTLPSSPKSRDNEEAGGDTGRQGHSGLGLLAQSDARGLSDEDREAIQDALSNAPDSDTLASQVRALLQVAQDGETREGTAPGQFGFNISKERKLYRDDILSLYYVQGRSTAAWFTDAVINTLLDLEATQVDDVHVERDLGHFLEIDYVEHLLDSDITAAENGREPIMGWPLVDLKSDCYRIQAAINPSWSHWVTVEVETGTEPGKTSSALRYYNSSSAAAGRGPTFRAATETLPKLLYLASLRPGSPLAGFDPHQLDVEEVICPQQVGDYDCGPFSLYFFTRRLYRQPLAVMPSNTTIRNDFGKWLRRGCVTVLYENYRKGSAQTTLRELFEDPKLLPNAPTNDFNDDDFDDFDNNKTANGKLPHLTFRLELGNRKENFPSITMVLRWSGTPM